MAGIQTDWSPPQLAAAVAGDLRSLNHVTLPGRAAYRWPADVDSVIASLQIGIDRLTQALAQASEWLGTELAAGRVGHDHDDDPAAVVEAAQRWLGTAYNEACELSTALDVAHQYTAGLTGVDVRVGEQSC